VTAQPCAARSRATVSDAGPAPTQATRLPLAASGRGIIARNSSPLKSAATRLSRQIATGSGLAAFSSSVRPRRQAGSHGRSQVRPRMPGNTLDTPLTMQASS
jgi:hypothetical protein